MTEISLRHYYLLWGKDCSVLWKHFMRLELEIELSIDENENRDDAPTVKIKTVGLI